MKRNVSK